MFGKYKFLLNIYKKTLTQNSKTNEQIRRSS